LSTQVLSAPVKDDEQGALKLNDTPYFELIDEKELEKLLAWYGKTQSLPRTGGQTSDHVDSNDNLVKVGKLLVAPKWLEVVNKALIAIFQDNCHAAACNISAVLDDRGVGAVEERFRVLPPINGTIGVRKND
jgi:hypothetical protein